MYINTPYVASFNIKGDRHSAYCQRAGDLVCQQWRCHHSSKHQSVDCWPGYVFHHIFKGARSTIVYYKNISVGALSLLLVLLVTISNIFVPTHAHINLYIHCMLV